MKRTALEAAETRATILAAGLKVFAERGYDRATLADIGTRAGVTRGAVYHHFSDKAELFTTAVAERWATVGARVWAGLAGPGTTRDRLRACLVEYFRAMDHIDREFGHTGFHDASREPRATVEFWRDLV